MHALFHKSLYKQCKDFYSSLIKCQLTQMQQRSDLKIECFHFYFSEPD